MDDDYRESELTNPPADFLDKCCTFANIDDKSYDLMQENFIKACTGKADGVSIAFVVVILLLIIIATVIVIVFDIRRAIKNKGRIFKI